MSVTSCKAEMKFIDVDALADSVVSTSSGQSFENISLFKEEDYVTHDEIYSFLGKNQFVLDGSRSIISDTPTDIGFWSSGKSGDDCLFTNNPTITINFDDYHTSSGLTLYFNSVYPAQVYVYWYDGSVKLISKRFYPDSLIYFCSQQVKNYNKLVIEFEKTNLPGEYIQLQYILYGKYISWIGDVIKTGKVTEELDVTGAQVSINTAALDIIDAAEDFNISSPYGAWQSVQKNQPVTITETIDGVDVPMGSFFIDTFSFKSNVASFTLKDSVGVLDMFDFEDGDIYNNVLAGTIIDSIIMPTGLKYEVSSEVANIPLTGYLAAQTRRSALQIVAFVCDAVVDDSRSDIIRIYKASRDIKNTVGPDRKINGNTSVALDDYVSKITIECSKYSLAAESQEIYNDTMTAGEHKITFDGPFKADTITASTGTIVQATTNYVVVSVPSDSEIIISGIPYEETNFTVSKSVNAIDGGESENTKDFNGCTLFNAESIEAKIDSLLRYYDLRKNVSIKYLVNSERVGDWLCITDANNRKNASLMESQSIDLTGGFLGTAKCRGYSLIVDAEYYTGTEVIATANMEGVII